MSVCIFIYIYTVSRSDSHWRKQRVLNMFGVQWPQSLSKLKSMTCARCALRLSNAAVCERFQSIFRLLTDPSMSGAMADQNMKVEVLSTLAECRASLHVAHRALCAVEKLAWKMFGLDPSQQPRPTRSLSGDEDHEQFRQKRRRVQEDDVETSCSEMSRARKKTQHHQKFQLLTLSPSQRPLHTVACLPICCTNMQMCTIQAQHRCL